MGCVIWFVKLHNLTVPCFLVFACFLAWPLGWQKEKHVVLKVLIRKPAQPRTSVLLHGRGGGIFVQRSHTQCNLMNSESLLNGYIRVKVRSLQKKIQKKTRVKIVKLSRNLKNSNSQNNNSQ